MRNRGLSKIYLIAGLVMGVLALIVLAQVVAIRLVPHHQLGNQADPSLQVEAQPPVPEQSGSLGGPNDVKQTEQSTTSNP